MRRPALALALVLAGCHADRLDALEARQAELKTENDRLARDLADLRKGGATPTGAAAAPSADRTLEVEAVLRALLDRLSLTLPAPGGRVDGELEGVWSGPTLEGLKKEPTGAVEEVLHFGAGGRLCGYRLMAGAAHEKQPFWGRWERHGRFVVELRDRWVGDHNEHDGTVRTLDLLDGDALGLDGGELRVYRRAPAEHWASLGSLYADRAVPIPGLPGWCFTKP